jgi:hypothetical protein
MPIHFPWIDPNEAQTPDEILASARHWFLSLGRTDEDRRATVAFFDWIESRLNQRQVGRPKLQGPSTAALQGKCRLLAEYTLPDHARTAFADRLTPKQIDAAVGKNPNGRILKVYRILKKEYSAKKLLAEFSS